MSFADTLAMIAALVIFTFGLLELCIRWGKRIQHLIRTPYKTEIRGTASSYKEFLNDR
jgi:hypothetical protein